MSTNRFSYLHSVDVGMLRFNTLTAQIEILVVKREADPFKGYWALPGLIIDGNSDAEAFQRNLDLFYHGKIDASVLKESMKPFFTKEDRKTREKVEEGLQRLLGSDKIGIGYNYVEQVCTMDSNDPRGSSATTIYMALTHDGFQIKPHQMFVSLQDVISGDFPLAFDHKGLAALIYKRLVDKTTYSSLATLLLPDLFTVFEVVRAVKAIMQSETISPSGQRVRLETMIKNGFAVWTDEENMPALGRPQRMIRLLKPSPYLFDRSLSA